MKKSFIAFGLVVFFTLARINQVRAQDHQLIEIWHTDSVLKVPESVLYDGKNKVLYTSNIGGAPDGKNGKGSIGKVGLDGKVIQVDWVTGLNGPKGLGRFGNTLYAADIDEVAVIDIKAGKITKHIPVSGAQFLNDITVDENGIVYVSDSKLGNIHKIENGNVSTFAKEIGGVNGLLAIKKDLYVLASGALWKISSEKKIKLADGMDQSTDGIEMVKPGEFVVSCWAGAIYYVKEDGTKQQMLDTRDKKINSADIGYDHKSRIVYVPTFFKKSIYAYELK